MTAADIIGIETDDRKAEYVVTRRESVSSIGYDELLDRMERICIELEGRGVVDEGYFTYLNPGRGEKAAYVACEQLTEVLRSTLGGDFAVFDLTPQLAGLEGQRVRVVDVDSDREHSRVFVVQRSDGWAPHHIEWEWSFETGGLVESRARREYTSVVTV